VRYLAINDRTVSIGISMTRSPSGGANKPMALVKADSNVVNGMGNHAPGASDLGSDKASR
jgi:hypothetical protein